MSIELALLVVACVASLVSVAYEYLAREARLKAENSIFFVIQFLGEKRDGGTRHCIGYSHRLIAGDFHSQQAAEAHKEFLTQTRDFLGGQLDVVTEEELLRLEKLYWIPLDMEERIEKVFYPAADKKMAELQAEMSSAKGWRSPKGK